MAEFRIGMSVGSLLPAGSAVSPALFRELSFAVKAISEAAHRQWVAYASGAPLPSGYTIKSQTGTYARSIMLRQSGDFAAEVFTELPYARGIEDGTPARDMHDMLGRSMKVRLTKGGKRYLIIPFRHYAANSVIGSPMHSAVENWWKSGSHVSSKITGTYRRVSGTGALDIKTHKPVTVPGWKYRWGTKLTKHDMQGMGMGDAAVRRFAGMYRFDKPAEGAKKAGGHQQFITFRVLMEGGKGWRVAARPGQHVARTVAEQFQPIAEKAFPAAVEADLRRILGG